MDPHLINLETGTYFEDDVDYSLCDMKIDQFNLIDHTSHTTQFNLLEMLPRLINLN